MDRYKFVDDLWEEMDKCLEIRQREGLSRDELVDAVLQDLIAATHTTLDKHGVPEDCDAKRGKCSNLNQGNEPGYVEAK